MTKATDIASRLSEQGYRLTPQRIMVLEAIEGASGHISAEEIYQKIKAHYPGLNISTVYRTMELLKETGMVTEADMGDGRVRFHSVGHEHHHHLVCSKCGTVVDLDESTLAPLTVLLTEKYGFSANLKHLAIFGQCRDCS